jgi:ribonucleoside-diphosphate reductase alpha chain
VCVRIPVKAPEGSIFRTESPLETLERVKKFSQEWILPGHINGANTHNVSATISIADEWEEVGTWMWDNRETYNGLSVLPYFGGSYKQSPFEDMTKEDYEERVKTLKNIDLTKVIEMDDNVDFSAIQACGGGQCEVNI